MVPHVKDILDLLEEVAPSRLAAGWDNPGLQVGSRSHVVTKILFALDPTLDAVRHAAEVGAQMLITHHPLVHRPMTLVDWDRYPGNVIVEAVRKQIAVACAHTNLDVSKGGINDILTELIGLLHVEPLTVSEDEEGIGLGRIGQLPEPATLSSLGTRIGGLLGTEGSRMVGEADREIRMVAVVGGAGGSSMVPAFEKGADVLVTGDVTHHHALEAKALGLAVIDAGHFSTEKAAFKIFAERFKDLASAAGWDVLIEAKADEKDPMASGHD